MRKTVVALVILSCLIAASVRAAVSAPITYAVCGSASHFVGIANSFAPYATTSDGLHSLASTNVAVSTTPGTGLTCAGSAPGTIRLEVAKAGIPGSTVAALVAVLNYRKSRPWPLGPADVANPKTWIAVQIRDNGLFVFIVEPNSGRGVGCSGDEFYRVSPVTFAVQPFDGCVEAHKTSDLLPSRSAVDYDGNHS